MQEFDVIIVGAGLVGATLACALRRSGLRLALVEARVPAPISLTDDYDQRVFALTRASENIFRHLGVWQKLARLSTFTDMEVWENQAKIHFNSAAIGASALGHIVELQVLTKALRQALQDQDNLTWIAPHQVSALELHGQHLDVILDDGQILHTRLLAGADGAESSIRHLAGVACPTQEYGHHALVASVRTAQPHQACARQRFLTRGPLAFLPLPDPHWCSIVWSTDASHAEVLAAMPTDMFNQTLGEAFAFKLGVIEHSQDRGVFPLRRRHAEHYVRVRVALLGDAAHTIHPLAGQGVNLGLLDAASLAEVILHAHAQGRDPGLYANLRRYERWRKGDNTRMLLLMDGFKHLFGAQTPALAWLRQHGLNLVNHTSPLKHLFMRQAMGLDGDLPALALMD
jgi:2-polyprenylphenol 6-hydroxylase